MDEEEADVNFELLRSNSTDLTAMSDDFLSMLNTDCKASDIDEFNSWFQDNITPDANIPTSDSILDALGTDGDLDPMSHNTEAYSLQNDPSLTTHFYSSYNEMQAVPASQNFTAHPDNNYIAPFNLETPVTSPYDKESGMTYTTLNNTPKVEKDHISYNQNIATSDLGTGEVDNDNDFYIKETYYQDESGNRFIEQEYIRKKDVSYPNGQTQPSNQGYIGTKRPRVAQQIVEPQYRNVANNKEYMPQKTVIRPIRNQTQRIPPHKVQSKPNPNMARSTVKVTQLPMQRQIPVKQEIRVGHNSVRPNSEDRNQINMNQKTRIYLPNDRGYQKVTTLTPPHTSPPQPMYISQQGKVTSAVSYQPSDQESASNGEQQNITPKDERLSPNSTDVITAWEQSIKDPSPGSITFSNGRVQIHRNQVQVKSPQMQVKSPQVMVKSPQTQVKSPQMLQVKSPQIHQVKSPQMHQVKSPQMHQVKSPQMHQVKSPQMHQVKSPQMHQVKSPQIHQVKSPQMHQVKSPQMHQTKSPSNPQVKTTPMPQMKSVQMPLKSSPVAAITKVIKSPQNGRFNGNRVEVAKIPMIKQVKNEVSAKSSCKVSNPGSKKVNHISITGKPGLVNLKADESPSTLKIVKPVNCTKPIIKQTKISVKQEHMEEEEEEPEEKRTNHNAVERKYRYSINDKIMELKDMLVPRDTKIQKSGVLRKAIEHINGLQSTIQKLKYDNVQLKKKQDILEQNNSVLTMKLAEQGATVVYLEKTPDLIEPARPYSDLDFVKKQSDDSADSPSKSPGCYGNQQMYQNLPDSPESLRQSDGEGRHIRSNSGSSGGYSSSDETATHAAKKPRYMTNASHRDQRTIPMLCMVFMFGLFIPSFLPQQSIASTTFGRSLLSVSKSHDYITPLLHMGMVLLGFVITTTLSYLFFVIKSKVVIIDEGIFKKHLDKAKQAIKNGEETTAQTDLEQVLCNVGVRVYHTKMSYYMMLVEYTLSILPHNRVVHWLCCNNSNVLSDMLLHLAQMQASNRAKRYAEWTKLCYALQASRYNITSTNVYITLSLIVRNSLAKAHFYRRSNRRDDRWVSRAKEFIFSKILEEISLGESVSSTLELQHAQDQVTRAAQVLVLSCEGTVERKQAADTLLKSVLPSLAFLRREFPAQVKELHWFISVLEAYQTPEEEITSIKFNDLSEVTRAVSTVHSMTQENADDVTEQEISDVIDQLQNIADSAPSQLHQGVLCSTVDWMFGMQIDKWRAGEVVSLAQKSNFKRTLQLLELFGGHQALYKVSLYTTVHRVMCQANPSITKRHLHNILNPATNTVNNFEQVLAIEVCLKYVPSLLLPSKDKLLDHMNVFLRSLN